MVTRRHYERTSVPESQSLLDIERLLRRHGVKTVRWTTSEAMIRIEFVWPYSGVNLGFRIDIAVPVKDQDGHLLAGNRREQERRRLLRVLLNHIKAKLVAVEDGLVDMAQEFLPYMIGPGGQTIGERVAEEMARAAEEGRLPNVRLLELTEGFG